MPGALLIAAIALNRYRAFRTCGTCATVPTVDSLRSGPGGFSARPWLLNGIWRKSHRGPGAASTPVPAATGGALSRKIDPPSGHGDPSTRPGSDRGPGCIDDGPTTLPRPYCRVLRADVASRPANWCLLATLAPKRETCRSGRSQEPGW